MELQEKEELLDFLQRIGRKLYDIYNLEREGKVIIANEKLAGVIKILGAYGATVEAELLALSTATKND